MQRSAGGGGAGRPRIVLAATILASSLSFLDGSVINVGLPAIETGLRGTPEGLQWVINAYLLPLSAMVLFGGALGDRVGRRRVFELGIVLFAAASVACAAAPTLGWLVGARVMQGAAAALLMPNSLAILNDSFEGPARGRAIGIWAAAGSATSGLGPVLGGWLIDGVGWRSIFVINLPLAATAVLLARLSGPAPDRARPVPLDPVGALLVMGGLGALVYGLIVGAGPAGWSGAALAGLGGGALALGGFVAWEVRRGDRAMVPLALFASGDLASLTVLTLLLYAALGVLVVLLPFGIMRAGGATAAAAGAAMLPVTVLLAALSPSFGHWEGRLGARPLLAGGCAAMAAGFFLFLRVEAGSAYATGLLPPLVLIGVGLAAAVAPLTAAVMAAVEPRLAGTASGFNSATARTGGLVATALLGRVMAASGEDLVRMSHRAALLSALACLLAAASALLVRRR